MKPCTILNWPALVEGRRVSKVAIPHTGLAVEQLAESMAHRTLFGATTPLLAAFSASRDAASLVRSCRGRGRRRSRGRSRRHNRGWSIHRRWRRRRQRNRTTSTVVVVDIGRYKWGGHTRDQIPTDVVRETTETTNDYDDERLQTSRETIIILLKIGETRTTSTTTTTARTDVTFDFSSVILLLYARTHTCTHTIA